MWRKKRKTNIFANLDLQTTFGPKNEVKKTQEKADKLLICDISLVTAKLNVTKYILSAEVETLPFVFYEVIERNCIGIKINIYN